jgi:hypothetical protein
MIFACMWCVMSWNLVGFHTFPTPPFVYFNMTIIKAYHSHSWKKEWEWNIQRGRRFDVYSFRKWTRTSIKGSAIRWWWTNVHTRS